jgi:penicillin-binding protein 1A
MEKKTSKRVHIGRDSLFVKNKSNTPFALDVLFLSLKLLLVAVLIVGMAGAGLVYGVLKTYIETTPVFDIAQLTKSDRTSYLYDANGNELTSISAIEYRDWVELDDIPEMLRNAFISVEDVRFYKHSGVDFKRLFSAALEILGNSNSSGGSTITQQLIKNKVLGAERTYKRKVQEAFLALQCEKIMEKDAILEAYLNDIYLGESNYGVKTAAKDYFGKDLNELSIRECAMIAGLTQNPYNNNPRRNFYWERYGRDPDSYKNNTVRRTNTVLSRMYENDKITRDQYLSALNEEVSIKEVSENLRMYDHAYFVEYCIDDVITHWMEQDHVINNSQNRQLYENKLRTGGYRIYTTLDPVVQQTVQNELSDWDGYPKLADESQNKIEEIISDSITIETVEPQAAAVVIDQHTGEIRAIVGGRHEPQIRKGINRATHSFVEVGSSIKPLSVYGPALDNGASPATIIANTEGAIDGWGGDKGYPEGGLTNKKNYGPVTLRYGLEQSLNVVAARLLFSRYVGIDQAVEYMKRLGIPESQLNKDGPGLALGTSGITPLQMCAAYAAIANNGYYNEPLSFTKVTDKDGNVILDADLIRGSETKVYKDATTPYLLVDLLKNAVESGTGKNARIEGYEVAGKTGTNSDYASVFFAGMTCKYTAVVWIGHDYPANKLETNASGGKFAATLWNLFMTKLMEGEESKPIINENESTLGLLQRTVCPISGKLATDACIHYRNSREEFNKFKTITDWFSYASVPTEPCDIHATLSICKESGCVAGKYCDPENIEQRTYVLLRPGNQFYDLDDKILNKIFGDTWVRTDRSIQQFIAEFPVCSIDSSFDSLKQKGENLIRDVEELLSGENSVSDEKIEYLYSLIEQMRQASNSEEYHIAYDALLFEYNQLISNP